jgi:enoyl-CoA hydratase/carnithine racemase
MITTERISEHVLWATIDRPEARNAINFQTIDDLEAIVNELELNSEIRLFILSGSGSQSFVAGGDLKEFHHITEKKEAIRLSQRMQDLLNRIERLPCWTIAFVNGDAYGGGIEIMLAFDFILSANHSNFGFTQGRFYLTPGWGGLTRLIERVGRSKALEWQGMAKIISADKLLEEQFVNCIIDKNEVLKWAEHLLHNDRTFIRTLKNNTLVNSEQRYDKMRAEIEPFAELWIHENHTSRVQKFMEKKETKP